MSLLKFYATKQESSMPPRNPNAGKEPWQVPPERKSEGYRAPVGPGSKSVPAEGNWRDLDQRLVGEVTRPPKGEVARNIGRKATKGK